MQPPKGWTPENIEAMAQYLAQNYYIDEEGNQQPRHSDADACEEWKMTAARLGVSRTGSMAYPDEVTKRAEAIRREMAKAEEVAAAAPAMLRILKRWKADLLSINPEFNDPEANALLDRLG